MTVVYSGKTSLKSLSIVSNSDALLFPAIELFSMKSENDRDDAKRRAGESAAELIEDGMVVGLGTGSTAAHAIRAIGQAVSEGMDVYGIPTSFQSRALAREVGIPLVTLDDALPDIAIDGADQVADGALVKGGGGAHAREKVVDAHAARFICVVDETKLADALDHPIPLEVLPSAVSAVEDSLRERGGEPTLRAAERKDGPVITDNGNPVLDCDFGTIEDPDVLAASLSAIPGIVEHGIFAAMADEIHVGFSDRVDIRSV